MLDSILSRAGVSTPVPTPTEIDGVGNLFHLLRNVRRRRVVEHLRDGPLTREELLHRMVVDEVGPDYDAAERKRVWIALYQQHLDPLIDAGVVEPDDRGTNEIYAPGPDHIVAVHVVEHCEKLFR